jgi:putative intracellular protease/amidase
MSRGIKVMADMSIEDAAMGDYDLVVCPGGMPGKSVSSMDGGMAYS